MIEFDPKYLYANYRVYANNGVPGAELQRCNGVYGLPAGDVLAVMGVYRYDVSNMLPSDITQHLLLRRYTATGELVDQNSLPFATFFPSQSFVLDALSCAGVGADGRLWFCAGDTEGDFWFWSIHYYAALHTPDTLQQYKLVGDALTPVPRTAINGSCLGPQTMVAWSLPETGTVVGRLGNVANFSLNTQTLRVTRSAVGDRLPSTAYLSIQRNLNFDGFGTHGWYAGGSVGMTGEQAFVEDIVSYTTPGTPDAPGTPMERLERFPVPVGVTWEAFKGAGLADPKLEFGLFAENRFFRGDGPIGVRPRMAWEHDGYPATWLPVPSHTTTLYRYVCPFFHIRNDLRVLTYNNGRYGWRQVIDADDRGYVQQPYSRAHFPREQPDFHDPLEPLITTGPILTDLPVGTATWGSSFVQSINRQTGWYLVEENSLVRCRDGRAVTLPESVQPGEQLVYGGSQAWASALSYRQTVTRNLILSFYEHPASGKLFVLSATVAYRDTGDYHDVREMFSSARVVVL